MVAYLSLDGVGAREGLTNTCLGLEDSGVFTVSSDLQNCTILYGPGSIREPTAAENGH